MSWSNPSNSPSFPVPYLARYMAVLVYSLLTRGEAWVDRGAATFERRRRERELASLTPGRSQKGFKLICPNTGSTGGHSHISSSVRAATNNRMLAIQNGVPPG